MPYIKIDNVTLHYETRGHGNPLILLNGLGMSVADWKKQAAFFSRNHMVITLDFRGQGSSDKPPGPYSIPLFSADAAHLLRSFKAWPADVIGLSMGGMVAFQMAVSYPELVKSMVLVNSGPEFKLRTAAQKFEFLKQIFIVQIFGMRNAAQVLANRLFPEKGQEAMRREMIGRWSNNDKKAYINSILALKDWSVLEHIGKICCPTLVVAADQDYSSISYKEYYVRKMADAGLTVILNSRHATPMDQPEAFNKVVEDFIRNIELARVAIRNGSMPIYEYPIPGLFPVLEGYDKVRTAD